jgi:ABC-type spermidine/putrescine transport system permease subunit II
MNYWFKNTGRIFLTLVFLFLYLPMASVVVYSFNASQLANEWTHFSTAWYGKLLHDQKRNYAKCCSYVNQCLIFNFW